MVAKIITGKSVKGILNYNEHKVQAGQGELLQAHLFLADPQELAFQDKLQRFERLLAKNPRVKTNAVHISLNFAPGETLDPGKLARIAAFYMERIGFGQQPYLVYRHLDAAHPHLHLVTTNIRPNGTRIDLHNIGRSKSEPARKEVELVFGLVRAEDQKQVSDLPLAPASIQKAHYGRDETKRIISRIVTTVTCHYNYTSLAQLNAVLHSFRITADRGNENTRMYRNKGLVYSILDEKGQKQGVPIKASALPGKPGLARLELRFEENRKVRRLYRESLKKQLDQLIHLPGLSKAAFLQRLQHEQVEVLFRENAQGLTYGITFVDHRRKTVFNGSELGKAYSANALTRRFAESLGEIKQAQGGLPDTATASLPHATREAPGAASSPPLVANLVDKLLQVESQQDYLPRPLQQTKRKRKRRRPNL
ncbi:relaxase/mobilization nuclease domain-containing protein [Pontibacter sp. MBLB2868]|uniref:relaxase/mobilization nuclease domain-containing protein n=1 Tax=Pontibacter sp. MBLB2868 TaxID=3451555 RepID=UPI003F754AD0